MIAERTTDSVFAFLTSLSSRSEKLMKVAANPCIEIMKMLPKLRITLSFLRDSPQPSHESAREYSTMVNTSCSAMVNGPKRTRSFDPSEETTKAGISVGGAGRGKVSRTGV